MKPMKFAVRRPVITLVSSLAVICGVVFGFYKMRVDIPALHTSRIYLGIDDLGVRARELKGRLVGRFESYFQEHKEEAHHVQQKVVATSPEKKDVTLVQQYVCQIHSQRHINVRALENGYLEAIAIKEGQPVKKGDVMFKIVPILYQAKLEAELAEVQLAQLKFNNTSRLYKDNVVSQNEVALLQAELSKAEAKAKLVRAELNFATVRAPFDGIIDRLHEQQGSLIKEGDDLTTLSDNSVMWVYFNVPEAAYYDYMDRPQEERDKEQIELVLANGTKFKHPGKIGAIEAQFNNQTGNIPFRADFPNPTGLLRHGQTGNVLLHRVLHDAIVIPQRATFEILDKRFVYVVDKDHVVHQREIVVEHEMDDIFVIKKGLDVNEKIVLEGIREVHDGDKVEYEFSNPEKVNASLKNRAE